MRCATQLNWGSSSIFSASINWHYNWLSMSGINQCNIAEAVGSRLANHVWWIFAFRKKLPNLKKRFLVVDALVGFIGGLSGMMTGMSGVILTMGCSLYAWTKAQRRALVQPFNMIVLGTVLILMGLRGLLAPHIWLTVAIAFPFSIIGTQSGIFAFRRLSDHHFQRLLIWLIFLSGLVLAGREISARL